MEQVSKNGNKINKFIVYFLNFLKGKCHSCSMLDVGRRTLCGECTEDYSKVSGAVCTECMDPIYYFDEGENICKICVQEMSDCMIHDDQATTCFRCFPGFYLYTESTDRVSTDPLVLKYRCIDACTTVSGKYIKVPPLMESNIGRNLLFIKNSL